MCASTVIFTSLAVKMEVHFFCLFNAVYNASIPIFVWVNNMQVVNKVFELETSNI